MKVKQPPAAQLLRPVLDFYRSSAVAVTGCHSLGLERDSCELDVIVVTGEKRVPYSTRIGGVLVDVVFVDEKEVLKPTNPEHRVSMSHARTVKDTSLLLSTSSASNSAVLAESARRSSRARLASSLKALGRVDDALSRGFIADADFWLLSASYDYGYALLHSKEQMPSPSHLLWQLKGQSTSRGKGFEAFSKGAGLEKASRANCSGRLEAIGVLHDVLQKAHQRGASSQSAWTAERFEIVSNKAKELAARIEHAEAYSFLGQEALKALMAVAWREAPEGRKKGKSSLLMDAIAPQTGGFLSQRILGDLGLARQRTKVGESLELLREQVSTLARWV